MNVTLSKNNSKSNLCRSYMNTESSHLTHPYPREYRESQILPVLVVIVFSAFFGCIAFRETGTILYSFWFPFVLVPFAYLYPKTTIIVDPTLIECTRGSSRKSAPWSEVEKLYAVNSAVDPAHAHLANLLVIKTKLWSSKIIYMPFFNLRGESSSRKARKMFVEDLATFSGTQVGLSDPSLEG